MLKRAGVNYEPQGRSSVGAGLSRVHAFFAEDVWASRVDELGWPQRTLYRFARIGYLAVHGFVVDRCMFRASALTYITVLSLVPMLALSFSVAKGVGAYERLKDDFIVPFLDDNFGPPGEPGIDVASNLRSAAGNVLELVAQTDFKSLGFATLIILIAAVLKMLGTVEHSLNDIWGVQKPRTFVRKLADYLSMAVVTPMLVVFALGVTTAAQDNAMFASVREGWLVEGAFELLVRLAPLLAIWIGFAFVYLVLPNTRTRIVSSLVGGLVGGTLWQIAQVAHVKFQIGMANYNAIYSSFAAIPIFLVWVYFSWVTMMFGAEVAYAHQNEPAYRRIKRLRPADHAFREALALRAALRVAETFVRGDPPRSRISIAEELGVPERSVEEVFDAMIARRLFVATGERSETAYLPARELESITIKQVIDSLEGDQVEAQLPRGTPADQYLGELARQLDAEAEGSRANKSLSEVVRRAQALQRESEAESARQPTGEEAAAPT